MSKSPRMSTLKCTDSRLRLRAELAAEGTGGRFGWGELGWGGGEGGHPSVQRAAAEGRLKRQTWARASLTPVDLSVCRLHT